MREYIQGPDRFYPDRALPKLGSSGSGIASLSGTASIGLTAASGLSLLSALAGSADVAVSAQAELIFEEVTTPAAGGGLASTQPRLRQLDDPELARYRQSLEDEELTIILQVIAIYIQQNS